MIKVVFEDIKRLCDPNRQLKDVSVSKDVARMSKKILLYKKKDKMLEPRPEVTSVSTGDLQHLTCDFHFQEVAACDKCGMTTDVSTPRCDRKDHLFHLLETLNVLFGDSFSRNLLSEEEFKGVSLHDHETLNKFLLRNFGESHPVLSALKGIHQTVISSILHRFKDVLSKQNINIKDIRGEWKILIRYISPTKFSVAHVRKEQIYKRDEKRKLRNMFVVEWEVEYFYTREDEGKILSARNRKPGYIIAGVDLRLISIVATKGERTKYKKGISSVTKLFSPSKKTGKKIKKLVKGFRNKLTTPRKNKTPHDPFTKNKKEVCVDIKKSKEYQAGENGIVRFRDLIVKLSEIDKMSEVEVEIDGKPNNIRILKLVIRDDNMLLINFYSSDLFTTIHGDLVSKLSNLYK